MKWPLLLLPLTFLFPKLSHVKKEEPQQSWIRINQLGYLPHSSKVAVWCSKNKKPLTSFQVVDARSGSVVYSASAGTPFGAYGPFAQTHRLNFSSLTRPGTYYLKTADARSAEFSVDAAVYKGLADFCLRYMRQQRCGFNPYLNDSCHTHDGYTMYGPMPDSTHIDVTGGWHDASDYLQYLPTSANATYHLLMAYRDFPKVFLDEKLANGLAGKNGQPDVLDEARWGIDWMLKMNPAPGLMFNQIADDRDHISLRIPKEDSQYGKGLERPVYFITGEPQGLFQYKNRSTGVASSAAKFASVFALADYLFSADSVFRMTDKTLGYADKALAAWSHALSKPGVSQTAPGRAPYFYEEDNWVDDMELAAAALHRMNSVRRRSDNGAFRLHAYYFARKEPVTPWLGSDTARHYQWYPFINLGHYELSRPAAQTAQRPRARFARPAISQTAGVSDSTMGYYRTGILRVWEKARQNAFYRGVPFIWCSNNLTVSFAIQCLWYRQLTGDQQFGELEQANLDWIFGCNPWGTSMVYGLPASGDTPVDPHSAFTHLKNFPIDGGLVDGPVYGSIFNNLKGIKLYNEDVYAPFQSPLAVYHDDYGDYSTNEPTMDGTACLIYLLAAKAAEGMKNE